MGAQHRDKNTISFFIILILILSISIPQSLLGASGEITETDTDKKKTSKTIFDFCEERQDDINKFWAEYSKADTESKHVYLMVIETFVVYFHDTIKKWESNYWEKVDVNKMTPFGLDITIKMIDAVKTSPLEFICLNYNKISDEYIKMKKYQQARDFLKKIIREFEREKFDSCFTEAEISLKSIIDKN